MSSSVLVTGGAGYIGSHTVIELLASGYDVIIVDNLINSCEESIKRVKEISGKPITFYKVDLLDKDGLDKVFSSHKISSVIHFAGLKAVGESVTMPLKYYHNNITGTLILLEVMEKYGVKDLVFSSSATVYGDPHKVPITEDFPLSTTNPYGSTKLFIEQILKDLSKSDAKWNIIMLRYFNPTGAHISGRIGEDPQGVPNNLMPFVSQVAVGKRESLSIFGGDWATKDGTGVRDFIHVVDLAKGHIAAVKKLASSPRCVVYNLGTGNGYTVLEMVKAMEKASGKPIPYKITARRAGDIGVCYADPKSAQDELGWRAEKTLDDMVADLWRWQSQNPEGFNVPH
eukprot:TRINITY_DN8111_c0_g1_i5.p1 TRINITY_DN8111_c0_g1~~TRINITY_DN8111_c0_g1_i5.p1  ORF type:complete len:352 (-),score=81.69 TRINITY_DN8111_c0_g1_i5:850-1875(-)